MRRVVKLRLDRIAGPAAPELRLLGRILGLRIATLDHEAGDHAMKDRPVVEAGLGELDKVLDVARRHLRQEPQLDLPEFGLDDRMRGLLPRRLVRRQARPCHAGDHDQCQPRVHDPSHPLHHPPPSPVRLSVTASRHASRFTRDSAARAAICSASFLLEPVPTPYTSP